MQDTKRRIPDTESRIQTYAELCVGQMRCCAMRPVVGKELEAHMEDQKEAYLAEGMTPEEAERLAVAQMGDPVEAGMELDRVHRPRMDWKAVTLICFWRLSEFGFSSSMLDRAAAYRRHSGLWYARESASC